MLPHLFPHLQTSDLTIRRNLVAVWALALSINLSRTPYVGASEQPGELEEFEKVRDAAKKWMDEQAAMENVKEKSSENQ